MFYNGFRSREYRKEIVAIDSAGDMKIFPRTQYNL